MNITYFLNKIIGKQNLTFDETSELLEILLREESDPIQTGAILTALRMKGETVEEIIGLIRGMRRHMVDFTQFPDAVDTCGTGGDGLDTFNISTTVAFIVAGAGVEVVKHGNKAASSQCGSADVLSQLGVHFMLKPEQSAQVLEKVGMIFLFAPLYHPAMKNIAPVRKALGIRTVFNFLGPFLNPAGVKRQLVGVPDSKFAETLAQVALKLGYKHLVIASSESGIDEVDITSKTKLFEIKNNKSKMSIVDPQQFGFKHATIDELKGGTISENAQIVLDILEGKKSAKREIAILNSAYTLLVAGKVKNIPEGVTLARKTIDNGAAKNVLESLVKETKKYA